MLSVRMKQGKAKQTQGERRWDQFQQTVHDHHREEDITLQIMTFVPKHSKLVPYLCTPALRLTVDDFGLTSHCRSSFQPIYQYAFDWPLRKNRETINRFQAILLDFVGARKDRNGKQNTIILNLQFFILFHQIEMACDHVIENNL